MLYIISNSPYYSDINSLINLIFKKDEILLLQDGILLGHTILFKKKDNKFLLQLKNKGIQIFILKDDIEARGFTPYISSYIHQISYINFVRLTVKHKQCITWQ